MLGHRLYLLLCAVTCWIPRHLTGQSETTLARRLGHACAASVGAEPVNSVLQGGPFLSTSRGGGWGTRENQRTSPLPWWAPLRHASARLKRHNGGHPRQVDRPGHLWRYVIFYVLLPVLHRRARSSRDPVNWSTPSIRDTETTARRAEQLRLRPALDELKATPPAAEPDGWGNPP